MMERPPLDDQVLYTIPNPDGQVYPVRKPLSQSQQSLTTKLRFTIDVTDAMFLNLKIISLTLGIPCGCRTNSPTTGSFPGWKREHVDGRGVHRRIGVVRLSGAAVLVAAHGVEGVAAATIHPSGRLAKRCLHRPRL